VRCRSEEKHSCLQPIISLLNHRYELHKLSLNQRIQRLSNLLCFKDSVHSQNTLSLLCTWLGYTPLFNPQGTQLASPETVKKQVFDALCYLLCKPTSIDQQGKLVFFVEDIHCADPVSLEFINHLVTYAAFIKFGHCLYSTSRSPLAKNVSSIHTQQIALKKLDASQSQLFLSHIFNQHAVNQELEIIIYDLADGNPLFMQELAAALKRNKQIQLINGQMQFTSSNHKVNVPCSVRDQLQQKLDCLTNSKNVAQIASSMGNEFDLSMLLQSTGQNKAQLELLLNELVQSDVICRRKSAGLEHFYFKHKLVRETIYSSIPKKRKHKAQHTISQHGHAPTYN
jgi:predicted ATPase